MSSVVIFGDTSGAVTLQAPAVAGTTTISLPSANGTMATTADVAAVGFAAGTRIGFQQTAAPTGWTKDTTAALNDSIMRIVTGSASSGGSNAFSTFNGQTTVGATTLSTTQMPSHSHQEQAENGGKTASRLVAGTSGGGTISANGCPSTQNTGGGGSHDHTITTNIKYYDFIIASKN